MRPTLTSAIIALALAGASSHADYNGGQIANTNDAAPGAPSQSGSITVTYNSPVEEHTGAVEREGDAGRDGTTTLLGNISITTGQDYEGLDDIHLNHGIFVGHDRTTPGLIDAPSWNSHVTLQTSGADDRITIDVYGKGAYGVQLAAADSSVTLDASASSQPVEINMHASGTENVADAGIALATHYGMLQVKGGLTVNSASTNYGVMAAVGGVLDVSGKTTINAEAGRAGIRSTSGGYAYFDDVSIKAAGQGISASSINTVNNESSLVLVRGDLDVQLLTEGTATGIFTADNASVTVNGATTIRTDGTAAFGVRSIGGSTVSLHDTTITATNTAAGTAATGITATEASAVTVDGSTIIRMDGGKGTGISAFGGSTISLRDTQIASSNIALTALDSGTVITVAGNLDISTSAAYTGADPDIKAVSAWEGASVIIKGDTTISYYSGSGDTISMGAYAGRNSSIVFEGKADITAGYYGVYASASQITFGSTLGVQSLTNHAINVAGQAALLTLNGLTKAQAAEGFKSILVQGDGKLDGKAARYIIAGDIATSGNNSVLTLAMADRSRLTGSISMLGTGAATQTLELALTQSSLWTVTGNSALTSLALDGTSWLAFDLLDSGTMTFANINATSIALADGAVLQLLGVQSTDFDTNSRALTTFTASLLNAGTLTSDGVRLVTEDNYVLTHTNNGDGTFTVTGVTDIQIPEPATATLGLLGLASLLARRRRA